MWSNSQFPADLLTITTEILNGKLHFLSSETVFMSQSETIGFDLIKVKTLVTF